MSPAVEIEADAVPIVRRFSPASWKASLAGLPRRPERRNRLGRSLRAAKWTTWAREGLRPRLGLLLVANPRRLERPRPGLRVRRRMVQLPGRAHHEVRRPDRGRGDGHFRTRRRPSGTGSSSNNPEPAQPPAPPARVHPTLTVIETQVKLEGCPDPNFPNVCEYTMVIWLEYTTPEPSRIKCQGFLFASDERRVDDTAGAITLSLTFSDSETRPMYDLSELTASCSRALSRLKYCGRR